MLTRFFHEPGAALAYRKQQETGTAERRSILKQILPWFYLTGTCLLLLSCSKGAETRTIKDDFVQGDLTKAAARGDVNEVKLLLDSGANINENLAKKDGDSLTPLIAAIAKEREEVALFLIRNGAALQPNYQGYRARELARAVFGANSAVMREIQRAGLSRKGN